jgi:hypothetical protein
MEEARMKRESWGPAWVWADWRIVFVPLMAVPMMDLGSPPPRWTGEARWIMPWTL